MNSNVYIRADGDSKIGLGHIVRCISLAHMLNKDFKIHFFTLKIPDTLRIEIIQNGWNMTVLEKESDFIKVLSGSEIVVLDGYQFDSDYQKKIKNTGCKLVCIDDFHSQHFYADLVINHAPGALEEYYGGEDYTKYLLGPEYALLRPEFLEVQASKKRIDSEEIKNIFVCFGGSDSKNFTAKVLSWLPKEGYSVTVIIGNSYSNQKELSSVIKERKDLEIILKSSLSATEMRTEFQHADLAIIPASGISIEALVLGVPSVIGHYATNQLTMYKGMVNKKGFFDAVDFTRDKFVKAFNTAIENCEIPENIYSPHISKRINKEFNKLKSQTNLNLRVAAVKDIDDLYEWANDPNTRKNSYNQKKIDYTSHVEWFQHKLNSPDCEFLIFENEINEKLGFVRFDRAKENTWIISINVAPEQRGKGYSVELLRKGSTYLAEKHAEVLIKAFIKEVNIASKIVFERAGFVKIEEKNINGEDSIVMIWK